LTGSWDGTAGLWKVADGSLVRQYNVGASTATVAFLPDGRRFVTGSGDKFLRLWNVASDKEVRKFEGHTDSIWIVAVSPGGRRLASGGPDKELHLWDVASGQLICR